MDPDGTGACYPKTDGIVAAGTLPSHYVRVTDAKMQSTTLSSLTESLSNAYVMLTELQPDATNTTVTQSDSPAFSKLWNSPKFSELKNSPTYSTVQKDVPKILENIKLLSDALENSPIVRDIVDWAINDLPYVPDGDNDLIDAAATRLLEKFDQVS